MSEEKDDEPMARYEYVARCFMNAPSAEEIYRKLKRHGLSRLVRQSVLPFSDGDAADQNALAWGRLNGVDWVEDKRLRGRMLSSGFPIKQWPRTRDQAERVWWFIHLWYLIDYACMEERPPRVVEAWKRVTNGKNSLQVAKALKTYLTFVRECFEAFYEEAERESKGKRFESICRRLERMEDEFKELLGEYGAWFWPLYALFDICSGEAGIPLIMHVEAMRLKIAGF